MVFGIFNLDFLAFLILNFCHFWFLAFLILNFWHFWGAKNRILVYSLLGSFLEFLDIDDFNKTLGHCAYGNDKCFLLLII
jgi:hypothetical protein